MMGALITGASRGIGREITDTGAEGPDCRELFRFKDKAEAVVRVLIMAAKLKVISATYKTPTTLKR